MPEPCKSLTKHSATIPFNQLALLAEESETSNALVRQVLFNGHVAPDSTGPALASDELLAGILSEASVYRLAPGNSPQRDFMELALYGPGDNTGATVAAALRRLRLAFTESRRTVAKELADFERARQSSPDNELAEDQQLAAIEAQDDFNRVNASYILVLTNAHALLEKAEGATQSVLNREFIDLLKADPYLKGLEQIFEDMQRAHNEQARKMAVRQFYEVFCKQVTDPTLYSEHFSAMVQAMLLRDLRRIVSTEARLTPAERTLGPYLANLFKESIKEELTIAVSGDSEKPQPILKAFRDCPNEASQLVRCAMNYLFESSCSQGVGLLISAQDAVACEVLLSAGCLFPELSSALDIAARFENTPDLNPSFVLAIGSALKFSILGGNRAIQIDPLSLLARVVAVMEKLESNERRRACDEILLPLSDHLFELFRNNPGNWEQIPKEIRPEIIEKVFVRKILERQEELDLQESTHNPELDSVMLQLLLQELSGQDLSIASLHPIALKRLMEAAAAGVVTAEDCSKLSQLLLLKPNLRAEIGISEEVEGEIRRKAGAGLLSFLAKDSSLKGVFVEQVLSLSTTMPLSQKQFFALVTKVVVLPLTEALHRYNELLNRREMAAVDSVGVAKQANDERYIVERVSQYERWQTGIDRALREHVGFLDARDELPEIEEELTRKKGTLASLQGKSVEELHRTDSIGRQAALADRIAILEAKKKELREKQYPIPDCAKEFLKDFNSKKVSIPELEKVSTQLEALRNRLVATKKPTTGTGSGLSNDDARISVQRSAIDNDLQHAVSLFSSTLLSEYPLGGILFPSEGPGARLGLLVRLRLLLTLQTGQTTKKAQLRSNELEDQMRAALHSAITSYRGYEDTLIVLNELVRLNAEGSTVLKEWPEAESAQDTAVGYTVESIQETSSLAEYLYTRLRVDVANPELAWISHDPGWNELFHGPIIQLFSRSLVRPDVSAKVKQRALKAVYYGCNEWVSKHKTKGKHLAALVVSLEHLVEPWTRCLVASHGRTKQFKAGMEAVTQSLVEHVLSVIPEASRELLLSRYEPFEGALKVAIEDSKSVLYNRQEMLVGIQGAISARHEYFSKLDEQHQVAAQEHLDAAKPEAIRNEGLDFIAIKQASGNLALPAPKAPEYNPIQGARLGYKKPPN